MNPNARVVRPTNITEANLVSSTVAENDFPAWANGTTYASGAKVIRTQTHRVYQSLVDGNAGHVPEASGTQWQDIGPTNRWAMFDQKIGTATKAIGPIVIVLAPGSIDALAAIETDAETVQVQLTRPDGSHPYDKTKSTNVGGAAITSYYQWFFDPIGRRTILPFLDISSYPDATVTVTLTAASPSTPVSIGSLIVGRLLELGETVNDVDIDDQDYTVKTKDDFGNWTVVERPFSRRMVLPFALPAASVDYVDRELNNLRAQICFWVGDERFDSLQILGFFTDKKFKFQNPRSTGSITIESIT
jgi:hypothetical protein